MLSENGVGPTGDIGYLPRRYHALVEVMRGWAHQDSNLGPSDYESDALTD